MASKDFKKLLQQHSRALFALNDALKTLAYNEVAPPILRYNRGLYSDFEMYFCDNMPTAPLELVWRNHTYSHTLRLTGHKLSPLPAPPQDVRLKALELLRELDTKRELVALYRCGYFDGDRFTLSSWLIPFPVDYDKGKGDGSGVYYTVSRGGVLGLATPYAESKELCASLL